MAKTLALELLHNFWLIHEPSIQLYQQLAFDLLAGKKIDVGLFGELELPDVPGNIALVTMAGPLMKSDICGAQGSRTLSRQVMQAANDPGMEAIIVLSENCPGGQVDGTQQLGDAVAYAKAKKPVLGAVNGMSCSAAYWVQSQCTEMYATAFTDQIGCIGAMARMRNPKKQDAENADIVEVYADLSPDKNIEGRSVDAHRQNIINPMAELFHETVMKGRGDRLKLKKENVLSGKTYISRSAQEYGMIDGVMPMNKIVARAMFLARTQKSKK